MMTFIGVYRVISLKEKNKKMKWEYIIIECHGSLCFFNTFISDNFGKHYGCSTFASHIYI